MRALTDGLEIRPRRSHTYTMTDATGSHTNQIPKAVAGSQNEGDASSRPKSDTATSWFVPPLVIPVVLVAVLIAIILRQAFF